jgi:nucleotide-binding universal stress UspA family protein
MVGDAATERRGCDVFTKLLVPLDGTAESAVALPLARTVAGATGATVLLMQVVLPRMLGADDAAKAGQESLSRIADELGKSNLRVASVVQAAAAPADAILRQAREGGADLIVMATHGRGGLARAVLGSVAERVVADSPVPVLLLRPGGHRVTRIQRLLVPVDGTPGGILALGVAAPFARATGAQIVLLQVVVPLAPYAGVDAAFIDPAWDDEALASAEHYVSGLAARLERAGLTAEGRATVGQPADTIVRTVAETGADVIVMSTHALTGPARAVLGSTADEVVRTGDRPVLLVRQH